MALSFGFSESTSLAVHACALLAAAGEGAVLTARDMAATLGVSESHLRKVLLRLARKGLLASSRGASGGFSLAAPPGRTALGDVVRALDAEIGRGGCLLGRPVCPRGSCVFSEATERIAGILKELMGETTIADFARAMAAGRE